MTIPPMSLTALEVLLVTLSAVSFVNSGYIPPGPRYRCPSESRLLHPCTCDQESDHGITVSCQNTNLASMSIGLNNLATYRLPIEKLTIYRCNFARLYGSLLYKLDVRVLHIEDTPIETVEEHTFLGVNNTLNELYILNSSLIEFPTSAFKNLGNLTILKIDGHRISFLPADAFIKSVMVGKLLRFHLSNGNLSELSIESLQPLRKLKTLDLHGNQVKDLKRNQFKGLRDVEVLDLSYNNIIKIDSSHLADLTKMSWCNISHNSIAEITRGAFARNAVLRVLNMSHNKIKRLDSNSFRGMRFLRRLFLSDNIISDIGRGTFGAITRIGSIDLARNFIKKIDYQMFFQLNLIELIDMSENNVTEIQKLSFKDLYLAKINLSRNAIHKIEPGAFVNCANITVLDLSYNNISNIPKKAFDDTTYATELQLSYNHLTELNQVPLHNMTGLKILNVSHNNIAKIPKNTFPKLYELHTIDLAYNNLSDIFNSVFQTLFSLRNLNLSYNSLVTLKPSTFGALPTLLSLDMSYNQLKDMPRGCLTRLASVRNLVMKGNHLHSLFTLPISVSHLDLSHNEFKGLPPKQWPSMNSLLSLDFSHNQLEDNLEKGSLASLLTLQRLNLNYNGMKEAPWRALSDLTSLQYLYMEGNNLTKLDRGAFGRLPVVFELNLAHNKLNNVSVRAFEGLLQLLVLNMTNNNLTRIPNGAFQGLVSLRSLDLSRNRIEKLDNKTHGLLDDCLSLEKINLANNKISSITRKTFPSDPYIPYKLKEIDLSYNALPIITYDLVFGTSKIEKMNLSHNDIADIRKGVIGNMTNLKSLDLSFNKLEDLMSEKEIFRLPKNLTELYLSNNSLNNLPWSYLQNVTFLSQLDIANNNFTTIGPELTGLITKQTNVYFEGNPLNCDCFLRPLHRFFESQLKVKEFYKTIKCSSPPYLLNKKFYSLLDERLNCAGNVKTRKIMEQHPEEYEITPDLRFRDVQMNKNQIKLKWLVAKNVDVSDTYVVIRDMKDPRNIVYETTLPYFQRKFEVQIKGNLSKALESPSSSFQICVLATDSKMAIRAFYKQQCKDLPKSLTSSATTITNISKSSMIVITILLNYIVVMLM